jgi:DNA-binding transcriptional MerR regulator
MTIGEVARESAFATSAVRYYERLGLVEPVTRVSGRRRYDASAVERLGLIRLCQDAGFSLTEIGQLLVREHSRPGWEPLAKRKITEIEEKIRDLEQARALLDHALDCTVPDLTTCPHFRAEVASRLRSRPPRAPRNGMAPPPSTGL